MRSKACWDSIPGMESESSPASPALMAPSTTPSTTAAHARVTHRRRRKAPRPNRYSKVAMERSPHLIWGTAPASRGGHRPVVVRTDRRVYSLSSTAAEVGCPGGRPACRTCRSARGATGPVAETRTALGCPPSRPRSASSGDRVAVAAARAPPSRRRAGPPSGRGRTSSAAARWNTASGSGSPFSVAARSSRKRRVARSRRPARPAPARPRAGRRGRGSRRCRCRGRRGGPGAQVPWSVRRSRGVRTAPRPAVTT